MDRPVLNRRYLADGDTGVLDDPEYDPEQDIEPDAVQGMIGVHGADLVQAAVPAQRPAPQYGSVVPFLDTDDPGAPGQTPIPDGSIPMQRSAPPADSRYVASLDRLEKLQNEFPEKKPAKWWQRAIAGGIGGMAGWSNAAGRARPIDIGELAEDIHHPGYASKVAEWKSRVVPAQAAAEIESQRAVAGQKARAADIEAAYKEAETQRALQQGKYYQERRQPRYRMNAKGQVVNIDTGVVSNPPAAPKTAKDKYDELIGLGYSPEDARIGAVNPTALGRREPVEKNLNPTDILLHPGDFKPDQVRTAQMLFDKEHRPPREPADPNAPKPMTNAQKLQIEARKNTRLKEWQRWAEDQIKATPDDPASAQDIYAKLKQQKQNAQDAYETEIASITGASPGHYEYGSQPPAPPPPPAGTENAPPPPPPAQHNPAPGRGGPQAIPNFPDQMAKSLAVGVPRKVRLASGSMVSVVKRPDGKVYQQ